MKNVCKRLGYKLRDLKKIMWTMYVLPLLSNSFFVVSTTFLLNKYCGSGWRHGKNVYIYIETQWH